MKKLYNTQLDISTGLSQFFKNVSKISKPNLKIIPNIIFGIIQAESVVTSDIVKKLKYDFSDVKSSSTIRRFERFFNNSKFDIYPFYDSIISYVIHNYLPKNRKIYISFDHMYCRNAFTILLFSLRIGKQRYSSLV